MFLGKVFKLRAIVGRKVSLKDGKDKVTSYMHERSASRRGCLEQEVFSYGDLEVILLQLLF